MWFCEYSMFVLRVLQFVTNSLTFDKDQNDHKEQQQQHSNTDYHINEEWRYTCMINHTTENI